MCIYLHLYSSELVNPTQNSELPQDGFNGSQHVSNLEYLLLVFES